MPLDLKPALRVPFERLYLDPNNPRLGGGRQPGYEDTAALFDERTQRRLESRMRKTYKALKELMGSIVNVGWMPVDAILVWEVPQAPGHFVVVEGNAGWVTVDENIIGAEAATVTSINLFVRSGTRWQMVGHHGSVVASRQDPREG